MCNHIDQEIEMFINDCLNRENPESYLIAVLHKIQEKYGYLSNENMNYVAQKLGVPTSKVYGVATFYHFFRLKPRGKYSVSVCLGTACFVKGANEVLDEFKKELGIDMGDVTTDELFSIEGTRCIGVCALAPVVTINEEVYSNVQATDVHTILNKIKLKNKQEMQEFA